MLLLSYFVRTCTYRISLVIVTSIRKYTYGDYRDFPMTSQHSEGNSFIGACAVHSVYLFLTDRKKAGRKILIFNDFSHISNFLLS